MIDRHSQFGIKRKGEATAPGVDIATEPSALFYIEPVYACGSDDSVRRVRVNRLQSTNAI